MKFSVGGTAYYLSIYFLGIPACSLGIPALFLSVIGVHISPYLMGLWISAEYILAFVLMCKRFSRLDGIYGEYLILGNKRILLADIRKMNITRSTVYLYDVADKCICKFYQAVYEESLCQGILANITHHPHILGRENIYAS